MLCIEIDESQHKSYAVSYEEERYNDLFMDFSGEYVFIRINPDSFKQNGRRVNPDFNSRIQEALPFIQQFIDNGGVTDNLVEIHHLFYDANRA